MNIFSLAVLRKNVFVTGLLLVCVGFSSRVSALRPQDSALIKAAKRGELEKMRRQIKAGADVNVFAPDGRTPLHHAAFLFTKPGELPNPQDVRNKTDCVRELLTNGAIVDLPTTGDKGVTALQNAAASGLRDAAQLLLDAGADVNMADSDGRTALRAAAGTGRADIVRLFLEPSWRANVNTQDRDRVTPLHSAASHAGPEVVRLLLQARANQELKDFRGETPLQRATRFAHLVTLPELLPFASRENIEGALQLACALRGDPARVQREAKVHIDDAQLHKMTRDWSSAIRDLEAELRRRQPVAQPRPVSPVAAPAASFRPAAPSPTPQPAMLVGGCPPCPAPRPVRSKKVWLRWEPLKEIEVEPRWGTRGEVGYIELPNGRWRGKKVLIKPHSVEPPYYKADGQINFDYVNPNRPTEPLSRGLFYWVEDDATATRQIGSRAWDDRAAVRPSPDGPGFMYFFDSQGSGAQQGSPAGYYRGPWRGGVIPTQRPQASDLGPTHPFDHSQAPVLAPSVSLAQAVQDGDFEAVRSLVPSASLDELDKAMSTAWEAYKRYRPDDDHNTLLFALYRVIKQEYRNRTKP